MIQPSQFKYSTRLAVRSYEVDWQGIVHNAIYLQYFEHGRLEYLRHIGVVVDTGAAIQDARVVIARNELNYYSPARFGDELEVFSRVALFGRTSFTFEGFISEIGSGRAIADNICVHVWVNPASGKPIEVPEAFRGLVGAFEGDRTQ